MSLDHSHFEVIRKPFIKEINIPSSKSYANRLLILAAISRDDILVENLPLSTDVSLMLSCLKQIGLMLEYCEEGVYIKGSFPECEKEGPHILMTGDGGTTNRFLCSLLSRGKQKYILRASGHMLKRPMLPMLKALEELGVRTTYESENEWITIQGPISNLKQVNVDASETTQFLTSVSLGLADLDIKVEPKNLKVSLPYWKLTQKLRDDFQSKCLSYFNPVDFSSLTYPLALAAVGGEVTINNCSQVDELQADSAFIGLLEKMGAQVKWSKKGLTVKHDQLRPINFDGSQCPDAVPTILFVCCFCTGESRIFNLEVLTHKECDRFLEMIRMLEAFGASLEVDKDNYEIIVKGPLSSCEALDYNPPADHRMVMVAYLFQRSLGGGKLTNTQHVAKSFSSFFDVME